MKVFTRERSLVVRYLWRISRHGDLEGLGGEKTDGRWHTAGRGKRVVYLSEHSALALIEVLANLKGNPKLFPNAYQLMKIAVEDRVSRRLIGEEMLEDGWRRTVEATRAVGDAWLSEGGSALLAVPSAPSPESTNYLLNPNHTDAAGLRVVWCRTVAYDRRLFHI